MQLTQGFRVPGIYTALKRGTSNSRTVNGFRVPGIYTALKQGMDSVGQTFRF